MLADESDALVVTSGAQPNVCITDEPGGDLIGAAKGPSLVEMAESMDVVSSDFEGGRRQASSTRGPANDATSAYISQVPAPSVAVQHSPAMVTVEAHGVLERLLAENELKDRAQAKFGGSSGIPPTVAGPKAADEPTVGICCAVWQLIFLFFCPARHTCARSALAGRERVLRHRERVRYNNRRCSCRVGIRNRSSQDRRRLFKLRYHHTCILHR